MTEKVQKGLFKLFSEVRDSSDLKLHGIGLGLTIVKKLVTEVLEGKVRVVSKQMYGSTFELEFPVFGGTFYEEEKEIKDQYGSNIYQTSDASALGEFYGQVW